MNIVLAPDSFKGSLTANEVAETMKRAILDLDQNHTVITKPMADGGEGTLDAVLSSIHGEKITVTCTGPLGEQIETSYAIIDSNQAVIELASIAGLVQVPLNQRNPDHTTTFGLGEVIKDALNRNCSSIIIGLGGSATNDGGLGMLIALGMKAWNEEGVLLKGFGKDLFQLSKISLKELDPRLQKVELIVASDVDNPLFGEKGASFVFGPQKGATPTQVARYDQAMKRYGGLIEKELRRELTNIPGTGAAGGLGFALLALNAKLTSGAKLLANQIALQDDIQKADLVITGEGKSDEQTLYGKAPGYVASLAFKYRVPVVLLSGSLDGDLDVLRRSFSGCFSIINKPTTLNESMNQAKHLLYEQTRLLINFISEIHQNKVEI